MDDDLGSEAALFTMVALWPPWWRLGPHGGALGGWKAPSPNWGAPTQQQALWHCSGMQSEGECENSEYAAPTRMVKTLGLMVPANSWFGNLVVHNSL